MPPLVIRILLVLALIAGAFILPWWLSALIVFVLAIYIPFFLEAVVIGILLDGLYASPDSVLTGFQFFFTVLFLVVVIVGMLVRNRMRT